MTTPPTADRNQRALPEPPVRWDTLTPTDAEQKLATLGTWVTRLTDRYELDARTIPPCWREHGTLIEELSALHTAWQASYTLTAGGTAPLTWHASFAACRARLNDYTSRTGCTAASHRDSVRQCTTRSASRPAGQFTGKAQ